MSRHNEARAIDIVRLLRHRAQDDSTRNHKSIYLCEFISTYFNNFFYLILHNLNVKLRLTWSWGFWRRSGPPRFPSFSLESWEYPVPLAGTPWLLIDPSRPGSYEERRIRENMWLYRITGCNSVTYISDTIKYFDIQSILYIEYQLILINLLFWTFYFEYL